MDSGVLEEAGWEVIFVRRCGTIAGGGISLRRTADREAGRSCKSCGCVPSVAARGNCFKPCTDDGDDDDARDAVPIMSLVDVERVWDIEVAGRGTVSARRLFAIADAGREVERVDC
jgi:hypothetical protein